MTSRTTNLGALTPFARRWEVPSYSLNRTRYGKRRKPASSNVRPKMQKHCCDAMQRQAEFSCAVHLKPEECPDALISYSDRFREYGFPIHDGGSGCISVAFCPWCGSKLPESLRDRWFEELSLLGFDDPWSQDIPEKFRTGAWYRVA